MIETMIIIGIISLTVAFVIWWAVKRWNSSWEGILKDKIIKERQNSSGDEDDPSINYSKSYVLTFEIAEGKIIKQSVGKGKFELATVGDKFIKTKKSWNAKKV